jgi:outer membrane biosynthesis protein TonB
VPKPLDRQTPDGIERRPIDPKDNGNSSAVGTCDEVSCMLTDYEGTCCTKFGSPHTQITHTKPSTDALPDTLTRDSIWNGMALVKARVAACRDRSPARGKVRVRVGVGANGLVTSVRVDETPDAALGACVAAAVRLAVFPSTHQGGSFSYPFVF